VFGNNPEATKIITNKKLNFMKKILLFLCLALLATSCATQKPTNLTSDLSPRARRAVFPVYYNGNDEPAATSGVVSYSDEQ
jgi:hypothetical protein